MEDDNSEPIYEWAPNQDTSWVVLDHDERFSPTEHLAFPFMDSSSSGTQGQGAVRSRSFSRPLTPGISLFGPGATTNTFTPGAALNLPQSLSARSSPIFTNRENAGERMLEAEQTLNFLPWGYGRHSQSSQDSLYSFHADEEFVSSSEIRRANSAEFQNSKTDSCDADIENPLKAVKRSKSTSEHIEQLVRDIRTQGIAPDLTEKEKELLKFVKNQKTKEVGKEKDIKHLNFLTPENCTRKDDVKNSWFRQQISCFMKVLKDYYIPLATTHVLAVLVGVYVGKTIAKK